MIYTGFVSIFTSIIVLINSTLNIRSFMLHNIFLFLRSSCSQVKDECSEQWFASLFYHEMSEFALYRELAIILKEENWQY